jgi:hypothetical protein
MRLLNVDTFKLEEFFSSPPRYAILSHTWGSDSEEVSFRDVLDGRLNSESSRPPKIKGSCKIAKKDGYQYIWIDTCCIDKTNSVELQEAINSMYAWYKGSAICYAYLSDVPPGDDPKCDRSTFSSSRWFQRGWTLQELLAPADMRFYDAGWSCLGTKGDLSQLVETVTGIPTSFLLGMADLHQASVAQRMSWAAKRVTKRPEDIAYSLLGIFGVSMPMIYGEGDKAFRRLQEQIMKDLGDDSILAWGFDPDPAVPDDAADTVLGTALAPSPSFFANSGHVVTIDHGAHSSFEVHGGSIHLSITIHVTPTETFGLLQCGLERDTNKVVAIPLVAARGRPPGNYFRLGGRRARLLPNPEPDISTTLVHLQLDGARKSLSQAVGPCLIHIRKSVPNLELISVHPEACLRKERALVEVAAKPTADGVQRVLMRFREVEKDATDFVAVVEINSEAQPSCILMVASRKTTLEEIDGHPDAWRSVAAGQRYAHNSSLSIRMDLEPLQASTPQRKYVLTPLAMPEVFGTTVNATAALESLGPSELLDELRRTGETLQREAGERRIALRREKHEVFQNELELEKVRGQIAALEQEARRLVEVISRAREAEAMIAETSDLAKKTEVDTWYKISAMERFIAAYNADKESPENEVALAKAAEHILALAVDRGYDSFTRKLIERTDKISVPDLKGRTPLHYAVRRGQDELVQMLINKGADIDTPDELGMTPLHMAAERGLQSTAGLLLDKGASLFATTNAGDTPLSLASRGGHTLLGKLLQHQHQPKRNPQRPASPPAAIDTTRNSIAENLASFGFLVSSAPASPLLGTSRQSHIYRDGIDSLLAESGGEAPSQQPVPRHHRVGSKIRSWKHPQRYTTPLLSYWRVVF